MFGGQNPPKNVNFGGRNRRFKPNLQNFQMAIAGWKFYDGEKLIFAVSKIAELWPFNGFQDGGRRHLEFTSGVYF